jgi:hypothetical protein
MPLACKANMHVSHDCLQALRHPSTLVAVQQTMYVFMRPPEGVLEEHCAQPIYDGLEIELRHAGVKHIVKECLGTGDSKPWQSSRSCQVSSKPM